MKPGIEDVKSFWDSRPCNIRHSSAPIGTKLYFDEVEARKYFVEPHIPKFANFAEWKDSNVLEVGCGIGTDAVNFARNGANYSAIELSKESLSITKTRFEVFGLNGRLLLGNVEKVDDLFPGETFDLIYSFGVLHHTPDIKKALTALRKLAKMTTKLRIMVYAKYSWKSALIEAGLEQPEANFGCPIANVYTREEIQKLMLDTGWKVTKLSQDHIFPYVVSEYKNYNYKLEPFFEHMPAAIYAALQSHLGWHLLVEATPI